MSNCVIATALGCQRRLTFYFGQQGKKFFSHNGLLVVGSQDFKVKTLWITCDLLDHSFE